ncbi:hypothetical protein GCM10023211_15800 [Orbus sasakiae]|uniref:MnmC-like methyltransferase domain-containing protein n=1 Tax=Orbus sasakiae TaxID=1078475 RepID=A0ABP9N737_9GAMM
MKTDNIVWNENNTPISTHFDDVYFSNDDAIAETQYVFIDGNHLNERFLAHEGHLFTIGETGFGSGLNFLIAWQQFLQFRQHNPTHPLQQLQFISIEKYPLSTNELISIHHAIIKQPLLMELAHQLQQQWPSTAYQFNSVRLHVLFADISEFTSHLNHFKSGIDAWFFDGFSPAKNPAMWSNELFSELYKHTNKQATFATFTAAGQVKRHLLNAGFSVSKRKGYGKKREMLIGYKD